MKDEAKMRKEFMDFMQRFVNKYNCRIRIDNENELVAISMNTNNDEVYSPADEDSVRLYYDPLDTLEPNTKK